LSITYKLGSIPSGVAGVRATLELMRSIVNEYKTDRAVRETALSIVSGFMQKHEIKEILSLHKFVRDRIRYVKDVRGVETLQTPDQTLRLKQGDCDDKSMLLAAMLESIGYKTAFNAVGFYPDHFAHVYPLVFFRGKWLALEVTEPVDAGWVPKDKIKSVMRLNNESF